MLVKPTLELPLDKDSHHRPKIQLVYSILNQSTTCQKYFTWDKTVGANKRKVKRSIFPDPRFPLDLTLTYIVVSCACAACVYQRVVCRPMINWSLEAKDPHNSARLEKPVFRNLTMENNFQTAYKWPTMVVIRMEQTPCFWITHHFFNKACFVFCIWEASIFLCIALSLSHL